MRRIILSLLVSQLGMCFSVSAYGSDLIPLSPDHVALTTQESPSLCWLQKQPIAERNIIFILKDPRDMKATVEIKLPSSIIADEGGKCRCVHLKDYNVQIEPDVQYRWFLSTVKSSAVETRHLIAGGVIERCSFQDCLIVDDLPLGCDEKAVMSFGRAGLWYDSISCLCQLIEADPRNEKLRRLLDRLVKDAGIILVES